jgi:hypothetical protein
MRRTRRLQELRQMRFEEAYEASGGWAKRRGPPYAGMTPCRTVGRAALGPPYGLPESATPSCRRI